MITLPQPTFELIPHDLSGTWDHGHECNSRTLIVCVLHDRNERTGVRECRPWHNRRISHSRGGCRAFLHVRRRGVQVSELSGERGVAVVADLLQCSRFRLRNNADLVAQRDESNVSSQTHSSKLTSSHARASGGQESMRCRSCGLGMPRCQAPSQQSSVSARSSWARTFASSP